MPGLTRKCRPGETFRVGEATIRVVQTGRKPVINIIAPPHVDIEHIAGGVTVVVKNERGARRIDTQGRY